MQLYNTLIRVTRINVNSNDLIKETQSVGLKTVMIPKTGKGDVELTEATKHIYNDVSFDIFVPMVNESNNSSIRNNINIDLDGFINESVIEEANKEIRNSSGMLFKFLPFKLNNSLISDAHDYYGKTVSVYQFGSVKINNKNMVVEDNDVINEIRDNFHVIHLIIKTNNQENLSSKWEVGDIRNSSTTHIDMFKDQGGDVALLGKFNSDIFDKPVDCYFEETSVLNYSFPFKVPLLHVIRSYKCVEGFNGLTTNGICPYRKTQSSHQTEDMMFNNCLHQCLQARTDEMIHNYDFKNMDIFLGVLTSIAGKSSGEDVEADIDFVTHALRATGKYIHQLISFEPNRYNATLRDLTMDISKNVFMDNLFSINSTILDYQEMLDVNVLIMQLFLTNKSIYFPDEEFLSGACRDDSNSEMFGHYDVFSTEEVDMSTILSMMDQYQTELDEEEEL